MGPKRRFEIFLKFLILYMKFEANSTHILTKIAYVERNSGVKGSTWTKMT